MRLVYTTHDADRGRTLANFLSSEGIENQLEMVKSSDWGNADYGDMTFKIWVIDEDVAETAEQWANAFDKDPTNPKFQKSGFKTTVLPTILSPGEQATKGNGPKIADIMNAGKKGRLNDPALRPEALSSITTCILMLCCLFYLISSLTTPTITSIPSNLPPVPIVSSPIKKQFLYDYPQTYELVDKLVKLYGVEKLQTPEELPPEGQYILKEVHNTPYWEGFYNQLLDHFTNTKPLHVDAPLFEKIKQGEVWRLFTPCLMHSDFLHILFNMLWLLVLGKQLEQRLNARRYLLLIVLIGIFSNTCQYLMSGPNFIGFSGVVCGMVTFIWVRQKIAPWEGYPLEQGTSMFIVYFISALLAIQLVSFYLEVNHNLSISPGIANTAHLTGAAIGVVLGFIPFFKKSNHIVRPTK